MARRQDKRDESSFWERYSLAGQMALLLAASLTSLLLVLTISVRAEISTQAILIGAVAVLYAGSAFFLLGFLRRTRTYPFKIALTGGPGAGKTVFSLLLYDYLMNIKSRRAAFTADSRSAIATYQAIRGIAVNEWPPTTTKGSVIPYDGTIRFQSRTIVDLQIGDSAGEHWLNLESRQTEETDYISYVLSAHAIVHVISVETLMGNASGALLRDLDDLKLAARLMRSARRAGAPSVPLLVVISKMDLVGVDTADDLMVLYSPAELEASPLIHVRNRESADDVGELLTRFGRELEGDYLCVRYVFASIKLATDPARLGLVRSEDILTWILESATGRIRRLARLAAA